jgi:hypothetical protein
MPLDAPVMRMTRAGACDISIPSVTADGFGFGVQPYTGF